MFKYLLSCFVIAVVSILAFNFLQVKADGTVFYFNNAVNTNPATLGNYWLDYDATIPAVSLPNLSVDVLNILPDSTYSGNAIFRGTGQNEGTVTGNATFYEDLSEDLGEVIGAKSRRYTEDITTGRSFQVERGGGWLVVADGAVVDITSIRFDETTSFSHVAPGYFLGIVNPDSFAFNKNEITLLYLFQMDTNSIPSYADFEILVNGIEANIENITIEDNSDWDRVVIKIDKIAQKNDEVKISYSLGSGDLLLINNGINTNPFEDVTVSQRITVGDAPVYSTLAGTKLYVSNNHSSTVTVIDTLTESVIKTISVGNFPEMSVLVGNNLYVNNLHSASVSVINTLTDTVTDVITVGSDPYFSTVVGTKIYVSNTGTNTVSVINTNTNTVTATVTVGNAPWRSAGVGNKVYVPNRLTDTVSVINTLTDTISSTIPLSAGAFQGTNVVVIGKKVFVGRANSIAVIDSTTDTVVATPATGTNPYFSGTYGNKLYAVNRGGSTVSVINATSNLVTSTITVGNQPYSTTVIDNKVYVNNILSDTISVINATTDTVEDTISQDFYDPFYSTAVGSKIYVSANAVAGITIIDTTTIPSLIPNLTSFSSSTADGQYFEGDNINITAHFGQTLAGGSTMTVALNSGASVVLNNVSGSTLSGTYTIGSNQFTPDLSITSIVSASVTDTNAHTRSSYALPSSQGNLVAENSFITRNLGDISNIVIGSYQAVVVGNNPYQVTAPITVLGVPYIYVANQGSNTVSVIRKNDHAVVGTITVGSEPYGVATIVKSGTTYVYVANTGSNTVSVINTSTNTVEGTISVGVKPYYIAVVGTKIYVTNSVSNNVSVINTVTNTVLTNVSVGVYPRGIRAVGTDLYVANYGDPNYSGGNSISVIDSVTDTVSATIVSPTGSTGARGITSLGTKVYVANFRSNNVSVINTATNTITDTIAVGIGPRGIIGLGTKIYVENFDDGTISIIDTNTNTVTATLDVGHSPVGMALSGTDIYVTRFQDNKVSILNTLTNTLRAALPVISNIRSYSALLTAADIMWATEVAADSTVEYGLTVDYGLTTTSSSLTTSHSLTLSNLTPATQYHYRVKSVDASGGTVISGDYTFRTGSGGIGIIPGETKKPPVESSESDSPVVSGDDPVEDASLPKPSGPLSRIAGKILLAVEDHGRLWYHYPLENRRYPVTMATALQLFRAVALGISNTNIEKIPVNSSTQETSPLAQRLKNLFLLQVENNGQTWYVDQLGFRHLVTQFNIIEMSRNVMTGILNKELEKIPVANFK